MKTIISTLLLLFVSSFGLACESCKAGSNRSAFWEFFSHGDSPEGNVDYLIFAIGIIIVLLTLIYSLKYLIYPNERDKNHIKYKILN